MIRILIMAMLSYMIMGCGEDQLYLFKLKGDIRKRWVQTLNGDISLIRMVQDKNGNIYLVGCFSGSVDFDPEAGKQIVTAQNDVDTFVLKLNRFGKFCWVRTFTGVYIMPSDIGTDVHGNCYVTGAFSGTVDFDPGATDFVMDSGSSQQSFVLKLNSSGNFCWAKQLKINTALSFLYVAAHKENTCYLAGDFSGTVDLDPGPGITNFSIPTGSGMFLLRLNHKGDFIWAKTINEDGAFDIQNLAIDITGACYITGNFRNTVDFDPGEGIATKSASGENDLFILKIDDSGKFCWVSTVGNATDVIVSEIAVSKTGCCYVVGYFSENTDFNPGTDAQIHASNGLSDTYVLKLNSSDGSFIWLNSFGGTNHDRGSSITFDEDDNYYIGGSFEGTVDFDPSANISHLTSLGSTDGFIVKFDANDRFCWVKRFGGPGEDRVESVTCDSMGYIRAAGSFSESVDFGMDGIADIRTAQGPNNIFVLKPKRE